MDTVHDLLLTAAGLSLISLGLFVWDLHREHPEGSFEPGAPEYTPQSVVATVLLLAALGAYLITYTTHKVECLQFAIHAMVWTLGWVVVAGIATVVRVCRPGL